MVCGCLWSATAMFHVIVVHVVSCEVLWCMVHGLSVTTVGQKLSLSVDVDHCLHVALDLAGE